MVTEPTTILVVDDDPDIRETLADVLVDAGCEVVGAANGRQALDVLRDGFAPCLVLLDLMMPVLDGEGFLNEVRGDPALAAMPVVVMSASNRTVSGADAQLRKPMHLTDVLDALARYCPH